jgi:predicted nucleic acid-binding protein
VKCLLDTNILVSTALFPQSISARAFMKAVTLPYKAVLCEYCLEELRTVFERKFPHKINELKAFIARMQLVLEIIPAPVEEVSGESFIRDIKDRPSGGQQLTLKLIS